MAAGCCTAHPVTQDHLGAALSSAGTTVSVANHAAGLSVGQAAEILVVGTIATGNPAAPLAEAMAIINAAGVERLSLREVAREAGIAPNSFYRQFRDMDELAVALIDAAGRSLRTIIGQARRRATVSATSVVWVSVETFMEQLRADDKLLRLTADTGTACPVVRAAIFSPFT